MPRERVITIGDEIWIATALLHREHPERDDFTVQEIEERLRREDIAGGLRPGVRPHLYLHCVANREPNPNRSRLLFATARNRRRLFCRGDSYDPGRKGGREAPAREDIPERYRFLLAWYLRQYSPNGGTGGPKPEQAVAGEEDDPILGLWGLGKEIWEGEDPDEYVRRLREGWE